MHPLVVEILEDGEVTFAEMERAVFAYAGCLEEAGFPVTHLDLDPFWYRLEIGFESGSDEATAARADSANEECSRRFFDPVFDVWADDTVRESVEEWERVILIACFAELGLVRNPSPLVHSIHALLQDVTYPGLATTPRDYVEYPSQVNERWLLTPEVLDRFARHYQTREPMPQALVDKIEQSGKFNQGYATVEYLAAAIVDMDLHTRADGVVDPAVFGSTERSPSSRRSAPGGRGSSGKGSAMSGKRRSGCVGSTPPRASPRTAMAGCRYG